MPKRINNIYDKALTFSKIKSAYERTKRRKKPTVQSINFDQYLEDYIFDIYYKLKNACIPKRGLHQCIAKLQYYMRVSKRNYKEPYVLQYDISKFFNSIYKEDLFNIMKKYYKDKDFLELTKKFIWLNNEPNGIYIGYRNFIIMESNMI